MKKSDSVCNTISIFYSANQIPVCSVGVVFSWSQENNLHYVEIDGCKEFFPNKREALKYLRQQPAYKKAREAGHWLYL